MTFQEQILQGIPAVLPNPKPYEAEINHAPKRKEILSDEEKKLALKNALRYFEPQHHATLLPEFRDELEKVFEEWNLSLEDEGFSRRKAEKKRFF